MKANLYVIGCGGVGSWLVPALCKLHDPEHVILVDGDKLEEKNLDRQLFHPNEIGEYKSDALAGKYLCKSEPKWFSMGQFFLEPQDWLLVCVDNHPARLAALQECDSNGCKAVFAANETWSAEAFLYHREWRGCPLDPRVYYPDILTNTDGDPRAAAIGCTGEAQVHNRQLVNANMMAASLAAHLFSLWAYKLPTLDHAARNHLPFKLVSNMTKMEAFKFNDHWQQQTNQERTNT